jgi:ATP-binding cassette subfamily C protein
VDFMQARAEGVGRVRDAVASCRSAFAALALGSGVINVLMLTGSLFMMQVYDRVLGSKSVPTLIALALIAAAAYAFQALLEAMRGRMLALVGERVDEALGPAVLKAASDMPLKVSERTRESLQPFRDLDQVRAGLSGAGPTALLDLPWLPLYLLVVFLIHPVLGWLLVGGIAVLIGLAVLTEARIHDRSDRAIDASARRNALTETVLRGAEASRAMGMFPALERRWSAVQAEALAAHRDVSFASAGLGSAAKGLRYALQSALLGVGAWLAIRGEMSAGAIIAGSIIGGRALAPVDQLISGWKGISAARHAWSRLDAFLKAFAPERPPLPLPLPSRLLAAEQLVVCAPGTERAILRGVSFQLRAGQGLGVIGQSASGKSTLARALVGVWGAARGAVRLDDAALTQWTPESLGGSIGYLPQDVQLFEGTVAENIARFQEAPAMEAIIAAAEAAGLHETILGFEKGYDTLIGPAGAHLSAGQRQRLGLARALYGDPFLVVLDEPNANLDLEGENAVMRAIAGVRRRGGIVIVVAHRPSAIQAVDMLAVMNNGLMADFGPKVEVLKRLNEAARAVVKPPEPAPMPAALREVAGQMRAADQTGTAASERLAS